MGKKKTFFGTPISAWNADTDLKTAYQNSTVWFYVELAKRISKAKYRNYLTKNDYGNGNLTERGHDFWNYGAFAISPINQIQFLKDFYEENLSFSKRTYEIVKEMMISEKKDTYVIRDKTGWTKKDGKDIGWWVGYIEKEDNVFFFATRITKNMNDENPEFSNSRKEITKAALKRIGVIE